MSETSHEMENGEKRNERERERERFPSTKNLESEIEKSETEI